MTTEVESVAMPFPTQNDEICSSCGEPIKESIAVFSGKGRGHVFHVDCFATTEPKDPEANDG
jgi:hypothetical protein